MPAKVLPRPAATKVRKRPAGAEDDERCVKKRPVRQRDARPAESGPRYESSDDEFERERHQATGGDQEWARGVDLAGTILESQGARVGLAIRRLLRVGAHAC